MRGLQLIRQLENSRARFGGLSILLQFGKVKWYLDLGTIHRRLHR